MKLVLITEAPFKSVTGASFYHRRLLAAWGELGGSSEVHALDAPVASSFAARMDAGAFVLVEGAAFEFARDAIPALQARGAIALIHHPTALEPGTPEDRRQALKAFERQVLPGFSRVIAASDPIADRLSAEFGVIRERITVVVPGTDRYPCRTLSPVPPDGSPCTLLALGTLTYRKGHDILLRALATLHDLDWRLVLAGEPRDPDYAAGLDRLSADLGIAGRVERRGPLTGGALDDAWSEADMFALATRFEGFGMAIAEAMARGLPVAICDGGAAGQLVPTGAGIVAPVDDVAQLGKALRRLVFSPALRAQMGAIAWKHAGGLPNWPDQARALRALAG